jgi:hypothetical protein
MIGDKQGSETKTFQAVKDAIRELTEVVNFIVKSLNGSTRIPDGRSRFSVSGIGDVGGRPLQA